MHLKLSVWLDLLPFYGKLPQWYLLIRSLSKVTHNMYLSNKSMFLNAGDKFRPCVSFTAEIVRKNESFLKEFFSSPVSECYAVVLFTPEGSKIDKEEYKEERKHFDNCFKRLMELGKNVRCRIERKLYLEMEKGYMKQWSVVVGEEGGDTNLNVLLECGKTQAEFTQIFGSLENRGDEVNFERNNDRIMYKIKNNNETINFKISLEETEKYDEISSCKSDNCKILEMIICTQFAQNIDIKKEDFLYLKYLKVRMYNQNSQLLSIGDSYKNKSLGIYSILNYSINNELDLSFEPIHDLISSFIFLNSEITVFSTKLENNTKASFKIAMIEIDPCTINKYVIYNSKQLIIPLACIKLLKNAKVIKYDLGSSNSFKCIKKLLIDINDFEEFAVLEINSISKIIQYKMHNQFEDNIRSELIKSQHKFSETILSLNPKLKINIINFVFSSSISQPLLPYSIHKFYISIPSTAKLSNTMVDILFSHNPKSLSILSYLSDTFLDPPYFLSKLSQCESLKLLVLDKNKIFRNLTPSKLLSLYSSSFKFDESYILNHIGKFRENLGDSF